MLLEFILKMGRWGMEKLSFWGLRKIQEVIKRNGDIYLYRGMRFKAIINRASTVFGVLIWYKTTRNFPQFLIAEAMVLFRGKI